LEVDAFPAKPPGKELPNPQRDLVETKKKHLETFAKSRFHEKVGKYGKRYGMSSARVHSVSIDQDKDAEKRE
jgi:hypothetical protein